MTIWWSDTCSHYFCVMCWIASAFPLQHAHFTCLKKSRGPFQPSCSGNKTNLLIESRNSRTLIKDAAASCVIKFCKHYDILWDLQREREMCSRFLSACVQAVYTNIFWENRIKIKWLALQLKWPSPQEAHSNYVQKECLCRPYVCSQAGFLSNFCKYGTLARIEPKESMVRWPMDILGEETCYHYLAQQYGMAY